MVPNVIHAQKTQQKSFIICSTNVVPDLDKHQVL